MIGSFLKGTQVVGHLVGDIVVAFAEMPTGKLGWGVVSMGR